jgi:MFS transporter, FSR family, fosmidomycin resistance protein
MRSLDNHDIDVKKFNLKVLMLLSLGHCMTDIYQGALTAALPFLKDKLDLSYTMAGFILIASNLASSVIQPLFGLVSDKKEKPLLLPLGCLFAGLGFSLLAFPTQFTVILLLVLISGLGVAAYHPEGFKTASYFTGEKKATGMSIFSVGGNLGFALGPFCTFYIITHYGLTYLPVMIVPSLLFVGLIVAFWKTIHVPDKVKTVGKQDGTKRKSVKSAYIALSLVVGAVIMRSWTQFGLITYIPFYYKDHLKGDPMYAGKLVSVFLLTAVIGTLVGARLADRWGHKRFLVISFALTSIVLPFIFLTKGISLFVVFGVLGLVLISSFSITVVMAQRLLPDNIGMASGLTVGFSIGTGGLGVTLLGMIADSYGVPAALEFIIILPVVGLLLTLLVKYPEASKTG